MWWPWLADAFKRELLETMPDELRGGVVHLCPPSGAAAVEAALLLAEIATGRGRHVGVAGGFHGSTRGAHSVSSPTRDHSRPLTSNEPTRTIPFPHPYRCPFGAGGPTGIRLAMDGATRAITASTSALRPPASLIIECVQGEGGSVPGPVEWIRALRTLTTDHGVVMVADEVQAGMCRTGTTWSFERAEIVPDVVVVSKALGGGVPIAALVMRPELNVWKPGAFTGTFRGNSLGFAAALAVLRHARAVNLSEIAARSGSRLRGGLEKLSAEHPILGYVYGLGLMIGVDIIDPDGPPDACGARPPATAVAEKLRRATYKRGVLVELGGIARNVIRFLPPLTIVNEETDEILHAFEQALMDVTLTPPDRPAD